MKSRASIPSSFASTSRSTSSPMRVPSGPGRAVFQICRLALQPRQQRLGLASTGRIKHSPRRGIAQSGGVTDGLFDRFRGEGRRRSALTTGSSTSIGPGVSGAGVACRLARRNSSYGCSCSRASSAAMCTASSASPTARSQRSSAHRLPVASCRRRIARSCLLSAASSGSADSSGKTSVVETAKSQPNSDAPDVTSSASQSKASAAASPTMSTGSIGVISMVCPGWLALPRCPAACRSACARPPSSWSTQRLDRPLGGSRPTPDGPPSIRSFSDTGRITSRTDNSSSSSSTGRSEERGNSR